MGIFDKLKKARADKQAVEKKAAGDGVAAKQESKSKASPAVESKKESAPSQMAHAVLIAPVMTEKTLRLQQEGKYTFTITNNANKNQVKQAISEVYGTKPQAVRIIRTRSQNVLRWGRKIGKTKNLKKAIVTMPKGTVLNLTQ